MGWFLSSLSQGSKESARVHSVRKNNPKSKLPETDKKARGMYDQFEDSDTRSERMIQLGLDPNNEIHQAAADALRESEYLLQKGKKTAAKDYGKKLERVDN